jgi:hypothetical protein
LPRPRILFFGYYRFSFLTFTLYTPNPIESPTTSKIKITAFAPYIMNVIFIGSKFNDFRYEIEDTHIALEINVCITRETKTMSRFNNIFLINISRLYQTIKSLTAS